MIMRWLQMVILGEEEGIVALALGIEVEAVAVAALMLQAIAISTTIAADPSDDKIDSGSSSAAPVLLRRKDYTDRAGEKKRTM